MIDMSGIAAGGVSGWGTSCSTFKGAESGWQNEYFKWRSVIFVLKFLNNWDKRKFSK